MYRAASAPPSSTTTRQLSNVAGDDQSAAALGPGAVEVHHGRQWLSLTLPAKQREIWIIRGNLYDNI